MGKRRAGRRKRRARGLAGCRLSRCPGVLSGALRSPGAVSQRLRSLGAIREGLRRIDRGAGAQVAGAFTFKDGQSRACASRGISGDSPQFGAGQFDFRGAIRHAVRLTLTRDGMHHTFSRRVGTARATSERVSADG